MKIIETNLSQTTLEESLALKVPAEIIGEPEGVTPLDNSTLVPEEFIPQSFNNTRNATLKTLTDGAIINWDLNSNQVAQVTLAGNRTLANPTNMVAGATYILFVKQDATGSRTLTFSSNYKFTVAPNLSTAANKVDIISFVCDGTFLYGSAAIGF